ncbi:MAG TPA: hypothetical protein IAC03_02910 [Candidatus Coprenecus pullistercoris]|nr:hypothetical protein [Candidatus Coprenecus pullistercoris]
MENSVATSSKKRNGFVTFWLWLGIIANVISPIYTTITYMGIVRYVDEYYVYGLIVVAIISAVLLVSGYALLLRWRRKGFCLITWTAIIVAGINIILMHGISVPVISLITTGLSAVFAVIILRLILMLRKDGISCWSLLS